MSVYVVAALTKTDPQAYEEYGRRGRDSLSAFENSRLAADDFAVLVEGEMPAPRFVLLRFDDEAAFQEWWKSEAYQEAIPFRHAAADTKFIVKFQGV